MRKKPVTTARGPRLQLVLWAGFLAMFILLALSWVVQLRQVNESFTLIRASDQASEKMGLVTEMIEIARSRARLTAQMIASEDPFEKDELQQKFNQQAGRFVELRQQLRAKALTDAEQAILDQGMELVGPSYRRQQEAAEMAISGAPDALREANRILMFEVFPQQAKIVDNFMQLFQLQRNVTKQASDLANAHYQRVIVLFTLLGSFSLGLAVFIVLFVTRRISHIGQDLQRAKEEAQVTLGSIGDAVIATDTLARVLYMNPIAEVLTGFKLSQARGMPISKVFDAWDERDGRRISEYVYTLAQHGRPRYPSDDVTLRNAFGKELHVALTIATIKEPDGRIGGVILSFQDVTESRQLARHVEYHAHHDALTGLLNRRAMEERVNQALSIYDDATHFFCAMDLDRFKLVNDSCGHAAGDELLRQLSNRLRSMIRKGDLMARMGGDEFAIFLLNVTRDTAAELAEKLLEVVQEYRFLWEGKTFRVGASIGMVESPRDNLVDFAHLLQAADAACYQAKHEGRGRLVEVPYDSAAVVAQRLEGEWVRRINDAIELDGFALHGQPIVPLRSDCDAPPFTEVLLRMYDEDGKLILPMSFLPHAERYGLMPQIDEWVVRQVVQLLAGCDGERTVYFVNLSGQSMGDPAFVDRIARLVAESGVDASRLCFELTETAAIAHLEVAQRFMDTAHEMGCLIALDDFGSGLSSFAYIKNLPLDIIKIDGEFIRQLESDKTSRVMVDAIQGIAGALGLCTIAEFAENEQVLRILREIGIDMAQGFHLASPVPLTCRSPRQPDLCSNSA